MFRFYQPNSSGANYDNWGIDDIAIGTSVSLSNIEWDLDNDGIYETDSDTPNYSNSVGTHTIGVKATLSDDSTITESFNVTIANNTPTIESTIAALSYSEDFTDNTIDLKVYFDDFETADTDLIYTAAGNTNVGVSIDASGIATISSATQDWNGTETIRFTAQDSHGASIYQDVNIVVAPISDIVTDSISGLEDNSITTNLLSNDTFEATPTISSVTNGSHGSVQILDASVGTVRYTPTANWNGTDSFTYTVTSGGKIETATVNVGITAVDDAPTLNDVTKTITDTVNADVFGDISDTLSASDPENQTLTYSIDNSGSNVTTLAGIYGNLTIDPATGTYTYSPNNDGSINALNANASDTFTLKVTDGTNIVSTSLTVNITAVTDNIVKYNEQASPLKILENMNVNVDTSINYSGGYIDFDLSNSSETEKLSFEKVETANIVAGAISIVGSSVYLGDGSTSSVIGTIDSTKNGENGTSLRINFSVGFTNGDMEANTVGVETSTVGETVSIPGWNIVNDRVILGQDTIDGLATPLDPTYPQPNIDRELSDASYASFSTLETSTIEDSGNNVLKFNSNLSSAGYGVVRGPYVYSDGTVILQAGDSVSFTWKAEGGSDAYDVFGYIVDVNSPSTYDVILNETGSSGNASTAWATNTITVSEDGEYQFVFIAGSYDFSGGTALGAQLFVDDVSIIQVNPPSGVTGEALEKLSRLVTYENSSDLTQDNSTINKTLTVSIVQEDNTSISTSQSLEIQEVNDASVLAPLTGINYTDTAINDNFSDTSGTAVGSDVDSNSALVYGITDGIDEGTTVSKNSDMGVLTIDKVSGAYTFVANDSAINALLTDLTETFAITVTDDANASDTKNLLINITAANDTPVIKIVDVAGVILEGATLSDNGSITFTDLDLTDRAVATEATATVTALNQDGVTPLALTTAQQADIEAAFSISNTSTNTNNGEVTWDYSIAEDKLDFLAKGEVITATFTITVTDDEGTTATQGVVITVTGSNDKIVASSENADFIKQAFGVDFTTDISGYFSDVDLTDEMVFTISGLPNGLTYDKNTGVILGRLNDIGTFTVTIAADDESGDLTRSSDSALTTKTFELEILAPLEVVTSSVEVAVSDVPIVEDTQIQIASGASGDALVQDRSDEPVINSAPEVNGGIIPDVTSLEVVANNVATGTGEVFVRSADITVIVDVNGQVSFDDTVEHIDFSLHSISFTENEVTIAIQDDYRSDQEVYSGSYDNGKAFPDGLSINNQTGQITGTISEDMIDDEGNVKFEISAYNEATNETRILKITVNVKEIKNTETTTDNEVTYIPLSDQLAMQKDKINNYGDDLTKLFAM